MDTVGGRPKDFAFVAVNGLGKPKQVKDKRVIRRHVMRGRNLRIGVRPVPASGVSPSLVGEQRDCKLVQSVWKNLDRKTATGRNKSDGEDVGLDAVSSAATQSCVSPFRFYHNLNACAEGLTFDFYTGSSAAICGPGMGIDFDLSNRLWYQWLVKDATYTHPLLFCISASYSILQHRPLEKTALYHLDKTITVLNQRLSDPRLALQNSTTCMVATLALAFSSLGEHATARVHMNGLLQMARLLGGLGAFRHCAVLYAKIARFDLAYSLESGDEPVFTQDHIADLSVFKQEFHNILYYSEAKLPPSVDIWLRDPPNNNKATSRKRENPGEQLLFLLRNLQNLTNNLNTDPSETVNRLSTIEFQNATHLLQYQLHALRETFTGNDENCLFEALRLAMLAFLASATQPDAEGPRHALGHYQFSYVRETLRGACNAVLSLAPLPPSGQPRDIILWILLVGAMTIFRSDIVGKSGSRPCSDDANWLRTCWHSEMGECNMTWGVLRARMKSIAWIDAIHDPLGKRVVEALSSEAH
ncbi:hypothetical protein V8F20_005310 [Naviculisporaceae sp. PSN 640]